jgi:hypothetical protein
MSEDMRDLERRSRAAFDASVDALDGETRSRLARARARAIGELRTRRAGTAALWLPAGAAAAALAVVLLRPPEEGASASVPALAALEDLELMTGEDYEMLLEEAAFYAWAEQQATDGAG